MPELTPKQKENRGQFLQQWLNTLMMNGWPKDAAVRYIYDKLQDASYLKIINALIASLPE